MELMKSQEIMEIIQNLVYPKAVFLFGLFALILLDLLTGVNKSKRKGIATLSRGFRNSVDKASTYFNLIISVTIVVNILNLSDTEKDYNNMFFLSLNGLMIGCVYIELKSIFENLIEINTKEGEPNDLAQYLLIPIHNILILKLKKNNKL